MTRMARTGASLHGGESAFTKRGELGRGANMRLGKIREISGDVLDLEHGSHDEYRHGPSMP